MAGVRGEALDILALALGVDGIEGERRFAGSTQAGDDDELVARDFEREVFEIVLTSAADPNEFLSHELRISRSGHSERLGEKWSEGKEDEEI